jgi:CRISPR-associated protein Cas2
MAEKCKFLICYDIKDTKRLQKLHRFICDVAFPVQYSVFETELTSIQFEKLRANLAQRIDPETDKLTIYRLFKTHTKIELGCCQEDDDVLFF